MTDTPAGTVAATAVAAGTTGDDGHVVVSRCGACSESVLCAREPAAVAARHLRPGAARAARPDRRRDEARSQGRLVVFADVLGFAGLSLLALQVVVSGRWAATTRSCGLRSVLGLRRTAGVAVLVLVVVHVVILFIDDPSRVSLLDPLAAPPRARAGVLALLALLALAGTSAWRRRLGLNYERWRALHLACTAVVIAAAFAHVVWVDAYTSLPAVRWTVLAIVLAAGAALFWTHVGRPYSTAIKTYRVLAIREERGNAVTLELAADGHDGLRFGPGQFARLRAAHCLYGMDRRRTGRAPPASAALRKPPLGGRDLPRGA